MLFAAPAESDNAVVATLGDNEIKLSEVRSAFQKLDLKDQANASKDPTSLNQVVRLLLVQRLMLSEAHAAKWHEKDEVKRTVEQAKDTALAENFLQHVSAPPADFPSDAELRQAYDSVKDSLGTPKQWRLAQIYIAAPETVSKDGLAAAEAKLETVKKALAAKGADFSKLAAELSDDEVSKKQSGEIGWMAEATIVTDIRTEATLLTKNEVSKPIRLKDGWHILKCLETRDAFTPSFEAVQDPLRQRLREERAKANGQAYVAKLLQEKPLSINEVAIKAAFAQKAESATNAGK